VASSADGTKLVAVNWGASLDGHIYTSTDSGVTWSANNNAPSAVWSSVASSADGTKLVAAANGVGIYTSTDSGVTWSANNNAPPAGWASLASSADGTKLVAMDGNGAIWTSFPSYAGLPSATAEFQYLGNGHWQPVGQPGGQIVGTIPTASLPPNVVTNREIGVTLSGAFSGNGAGLTNLNANVALSASGNIFSGSNFFTAGSLSLSNAEPIWVNSTNGTSEVFLWPRYLDDATYLDIGSAGFYIRDHTGSFPLFTLKTNGTLSMAQALGDRLTLYPSIGTSSYGFGISNFTLQIHTDTTSADIAFGSGNSTNLTETMRIKGNGNVGIGTNNAPLVCKFKALAS
jgi:hypothetical protein